MVDPAFGKPTVRAVAPVEPFTFDVPDQDVAHFKQLLKLSKLAPEAWYNSQEGGVYCVSRQWLKDAKDAWLEFDWRKHEAHLNSVPNFQVTLDHAEGGPMNLHFAALFSCKEGALPVLCMHSWPGGFFEYLPVMYLLAQRYIPEDLPYYVIVPSIQGFGTSTAPLGIELTYNHAAETLY